MKLCVGAVSRRVVEVAAAMRVPQIVASRRQVDIGGGYTGYDQASLVDHVKRLSGGKTQVVRDHGGPYQNGDPNDDWCASFDADVEAGFDVLHIDVCKVPRARQASVLQELVEQYSPRCPVEIGGERDTQAHLDSLINAVSEWHQFITAAVVDVGGYAWADRQRGSLRDVAWVLTQTSKYHAMGFETKAHNMDWAGDRLAYRTALDSYNVAPEFAQVEIDALLYVLPQDVVVQLLAYGYSTRKWERWFNDNEGTYIERARCALRYVLETNEVKIILDQYLTKQGEAFVRNAITDALIRG